MSNSSARKSEFLGMPYGTANGRLRKQIIYKYVKMAGHHFCHNCGAEIESVDDLSIEHIKPWEGRSVDLYWDLDNIAFSHLKCNVPHRSGANKLRKVGPEGTAWCSWCKEFKPIDTFYRHKSKWNGVHDLCKYHHELERKNRKRSMVEQ